MDMVYESLQELLRHSSSSRQYFLSLPTDKQLTLHEHDRYIHTAADLHARTAAVDDYNHHVCLSLGQDR